MHTAGRYTSTAPIAATYRVVLGEVPGRVDPLVICEVGHDHVISAICVQGAAVLESLDARSVHAPGAQINTGQRINSCPIPPGSHWCVRYVSVAAFFD